MHPPWSVVGVRSGFQTKISPTFRKTGSSLFWPKLPLNFFAILRPSGPRPPGHGSRKPRKVQRQIQKRSQWRKKGPGQLFNAGFEPVHPPWSIAGVKSVSDGLVFVDNKNKPVTNTCNSFVVFFLPPPSTLGDKITSPLPPPPCTMMVGPHVRPRCVFFANSLAHGHAAASMIQQGEGGPSLLYFFCRRVYGCDRNKKPDSAVALLICEKCANSL